VSSETAAPAPEIPPTPVTPRGASEAKLQVFGYLTQTRAGEQFRSGRLRAENESVAELRLLEYGIPVIDLWPEPAPRAHPANKPVPLADYVAFMQKMSHALELGFSAAQGLELGAETAPNKDLREIINVIRALTTKGRRLSECMALFPAVFDNVTVALIRAGETAGVLESIFKQLTRRATAQQVLRRKVSGAMVYPSTIMTTAALSIFMLLWKTVPSFIGVFKTAHVELPQATKALIAVSNFVLHQPIPTAAIVAVFVATLWMTPKLYSVFPGIHRRIRKLPVIGPVVVGLNEAAFVTTLANMLESNVAIVQAMRLARGVCSDFEYRGAIARSLIGVSKGRSLGDCFKSEKDIIGIMLIQAVAFGERSGSTEKALMSLVSILQEDLDFRIDRMKQLIEPLLIFLVGGVVFAILLAIFLPMFNLTKAF
jgi:type IV pilus assembly protein PilC